MAGGRGDAPVGQLDNAVIPRFDDVQGSIRQMRPNLRGVLEALQSGRSARDSLERVDEKQTALSVGYLLFQLRDHAGFELHCSREILQIASFQVIFDVNQQP